MSIGGPSLKGRNLAPMFLTLAIFALGPACNCDPGDGPDAGPNPEQDGGDNPGVDGGDNPGEDAGLPGPIREPNPEDPNNPNLDSDCDGLSDAEEFTSVYPGGQRTDPADPDSDNDGIPDGVEAGRTQSIDAECPSTPADADPTTTTIPTVADVDGDCINDGLEDNSRNGRVDPGETDPNNPDTDGDGLDDGQEDLNCNGRVDSGETDPALADTDGDGLNDGVEIGIGTDPTNADTDGDGVNDGQEVASGTDPLVNDGSANDDDTDGLSNEQEADLGTDPNNADTDGDGLEDGAEVLTTGTDPLRQDTDCDGISDADEVNTTNTDPLVADSDGDGILDGVEIGRTAAVDPNDAECPTFNGDADPTTTTNPNNPDTDGDGVVDGAEDGNQNGRVDPGELNPNNNADTGGAIGQACADPIDPALHSDAVTDILAASAPTFDPANTREITNGAGDVLGLSFVDATNGILAFAVRRAPEGTTPPSLQGAGEQLNAIEGRIGGLSQPLVQTFTTWDGYAAARGTYNLADGTAVATAADDAIDAILQTAATVSFPNAPNENGPFKLGLVVVQRSAATAIVVGVLTRLAAFDNPASGRDFRFEDVGGGTFLGQVGDAIGQQCDVFTAQVESPVDFIFVVDNSGSMNDAQDAVTAARAQMLAQLDNSTLDWRIAVISTEYDERTGPPSFTGIRGTCPGPNRLCICQFIDEDDATAAADFNACVQDLGVGGSGNEGGFGPLQDALSSVFLNGALGARANIRPEARVVVTFVSDAGEQTPSFANDLTSYVNFFQNDWDPGRNDEEPMILSGILCPSTLNCSGEEGFTATDGNGVRTINRYYNVINQTGGVIGAIANATNGGALANPDAEIAATIQGIIDVVIGQVSPYDLSRDPIASTLKVALEGPTAGTCTLANVPRSREDGFAYDATANRIAFFGDCRPTTPGTDVAVSYRTWIDLTGDPEGQDQPCGGDCPDPLICVNDQCVCPSDCGVDDIGENERCNVITCEVECAPDCNASCGGFTQCDTEQCACVCEENVTCAPGFAYDDVACQCVCDADALGCPATHVPNLDTCACDCGTDGAGVPNCNDSCADTEICLAGTCSCRDVFDG